MGTGMDTAGMRRFGVLAAMGLLLAGCGFNEEAAREFAKEEGMSAPGTEAFVVCAKDFRRNDPIFPMSDSNLRMNEVPLEVCACQAPVIASVFRDDKLKSHVKFAEYLALETKKKAKINRKALKDGIKVKDAVDRMTNSLYSCAVQYHKANKDEAAGLFEKLPIKKKKKKEEKKQASAG